MSLTRSKLKEKKTESCRRREGGGHFGPRQRFKQLVIYLVFGIWYSLLVLKRLYDDIETVQTLQM